MVSHKERWLIEMFSFHDVRSSRREIICQKTPGNYQPPRLVANCFTSSLGVTLANKLFVITLSRLSKAILWMGIKMITMRGWRQKKVQQVQFTR